MYSQHRHKSLNICKIFKIHQIIVPTEISTMYKYLSLSYKPFIQKMLERLQYAATFFAVLYL